MVPWDMSNLIFVSVFLHSLTKRLRDFHQKLKFLPLESGKLIWWPYLLAQVLPQLVPCHFGGGRRWEAVLAVEPGRTGRERRPISHWTPARHTTDTYYLSISTWVPVVAQNVLFPEVHSFAASFTRLIVIRTKGKTSRLYIKWQTEGLLNDKDVCVAPLKLFRFGKTFRCT